MFEPGTGVFAITPDDDNDLAVPARGVVFRTAGILAIHDGNGDVVSIPSGVLGVGVIHWIKVTRVLETTTVADLWGVR